MYFSGEKVAWPEIDGVLWFCELCTNCCRQLREKRVSSVLEGEPEVLQKTTFVRLTLLGSTGAASGKGTIVLVTNVFFRVSPPRPTRLATSCSGQTTRSHTTGSVTAPT